MTWPAAEVRQWAALADRVEDARIMRQSVAIYRAVHDPKHLIDLFITPTWQRDTRTAEEIIADTLEAWGGATCA